MDKTMTQYQKDLAAWKAEHPDWPVDTQSLMTAEDYRLALSLYAPLFTFHPSPHSGLTSTN